MVRAGLYCSRDGRLYRAYRELFLLVAEQDPPSEYRAEQANANDWDRRFRPRLAECLALVRSIHEGTQYAAVPTDAGYEATDDHREPNPI